MAQPQRARRAGIILFRMPELQRESLREILASQTDFELLATVNSSEELFAYKTTQSPDVVLFAVTDDITGELCRRLPNAHLVQITPDGRRAIVGKQVSTDDIVDVIRSAVRLDGDRSAT